MSKFGAANDSTSNSGEQAGAEKNAVVAWGGDHGSGGGDDGGVGVMTR